MGDKRVALSQFSNYKLTEEGQEESVMQDTSTTFFRPNNMTLRNTHGNRMY